MFIHEVLCNKAFLTNFKCQWLREGGANASPHLGSITTGLNTKVLLELQGKPPLSSDVSVWIAPEACLSVKCCFNGCLLRGQTSWKGSRMNTKAKGVKRGVIVRVHARYDVFDAICGWFSIVHVRDGPISIAIIIGITKVTSYRHASVPPRVMGLIG